MRALVLTSEFPPGPGGIGTHAHQLAVRLGALGWDISVVAPQDYASEAEVLAFNEGQPFPIVRLERATSPAARLWRRSRATDRWIRSWRPDVVIASGLRAVWLTAVLAARYRFPWMAVGHGTEFGLRDRVSRVMSRWAFARADTVVCVSEFTRRMMETAGIQPRGVSVIHNGADDRCFRLLSPEVVVQCRTGLGLDEARLIVTVGNVTPRKGQDVVIRALPHVLRRVPDTHYLAIGLPTHADEFMEMARGLGVADHVHFLGRTDQETLVRLLNAADVFTMTSRRAEKGDVEGFGIAVVEAALCGKPAVVSKSSGLAEAIEDGVTGLGVRENDEIDTGRALAELLCDQERCREMGEAAHVRALTRQTWDHKAAEYDAVLSRIARSRAAEGRVESSRDGSGEAGGRTPMAETAGRLLVISHTSHYRRRGELVGWGATVREIDHLSQEFSEIRHIACLHHGLAPESSLPYRSDRIRVIPLPPAGGPRLHQKINVLRHVPLYVRTILRELRWADVVHVRCPANIGLIGMLLLAVVRHPRVRWIKYAGNWSPDGDEPLAYTLQRWLLRRNVHRGAVSVNGRWPGQSPHVRSFLNPCLTDEEVARARRLTEGKTLESPVRLLFVGRVEEEKGAGRSLEVLRMLKDRRVNARLDIVGDGPDLARFKDRAATLEISSEVVFHGWLPRSEIDRLYSAAHFLLLPSRCSEGWPKVISEAMAFGVVPLASDISSIPQYLDTFQTGGAFAPTDVDQFAAAVAQYVAEPDSWTQHSLNARRAAARFTYEKYLDAVRELIGASGEATGSKIETVPAT